jgi:hypothetical protein
MTALLCMVGSGLAAEPGAPLVLERTIALKGVTGRIDHLAVDLARSACSWLNSATAPWM